jgi:hypothetical protein
MAAPPTTRPVALTPRQDRRRFWQEKRATLRLRRNNRAKKGTQRRSNSYPFPFFLFLYLLQQGPGKGDTLKRILPREGTRLRASLLIRGPPQIAWALHPLLIRGSKAGPRRVPRPPQATRAPRPLLIRGSKAGPRRVHSRLRHRARDDQGYVRYITKARAALPRYPRTFPRPAGAIL